MCCFACGQEVRLTLRSTYNINTLNRVGINSTGQKIAKLGIIDDEIITIPFFASQRIDTTLAPLDTQIDSSNVQTISAASLGGEIDAYFGAWIDINTPSKKYFPDRILDLSKLDGPFVNMGPLLSIQELVRSQHQCLLAEISFDPDPITAHNDDPSNNDKLAERNLSFIPVPNPGLAESRRAPQVFEIRPTPTFLARQQKNDELMIQWGTCPPETTTSIYIPAMSARQIIRLADAMYSQHRLSASDAWEITCPADGLTFIPVPVEIDAKQFAALITLELPLGVRKGQMFRIVVKQLTNDFVTHYPVQNPERVRALEQVIQIPSRAQQSSALDTVSTHPNRQLAKKNKEMPQAEYRL